MPSASGGAGPPLRPMSNLSRPVDGTALPSPRSFRDWMGGGRELTMAEIAISRLSEDEHSIQLRRAVVASTIGTAIEWYDFFLYSTVTGLVFAKLFFPQSDPLVGTLEAFAIYAVGFVARPIGAAIFGHYGDRIGRKATLIATLMLMGIATFLVALVPTYASIGIWGAVILTILRFIQGIGVGVTKHRSRRCCNWHAKSLGPSTSSRQTPACRRTHPT